MCDTVKDQNDEKKLVEGLEIRRNATISQVKMVSVVALLVFLMSGTAILASQNVTIFNESANSSDLGLNDSVLATLADVNASLEGPNLTEIPTVENTLSETLDNSTEKNETIINLTVEESNETVTIENMSLVIEENVTQLIENNTESLNETQELVNETINITEETPTEALKNLVLSLEYPEKAVRGSEITVVAHVFNADSTTADSVFVTWSIPTGFTIASGTAQEFLGTISVGEAKTSTIMLKTDLSTLPGTAKIRAVVSYE